MSSKSYNAKGQCVKVTTLVKGISAEEYDAAVARTPKLCPLFVMGDRRGGRELLNDTPRDRAVCLARWPNFCPFLHKPRQMYAATEAGRAEMDRLADRVLAAFCEPPPP